MCLYISDKMFNLWAEAQDKADSLMENNQDGFMAESELSWRIVFEKAYC